MLGESSPGSQVKKDGQKCLGYFALRLFVVFLASVLVSCNLRMQPKGTTVFKIVSKHEYERAQLYYPASEENRGPLKLKFVDTNTFQTSATLPGGKYRFSVHTEQGGFFQREIIIEAGKDYYELPDMMIAAPKIDEGPAISGGFYIGAGATPKEVVVVFVAKDVIVKRVPVNNGRFMANPPLPGTYRVEVFALGDPPLSWSSDSVDLTKPVNVGLITLK